MKQEQSLKERIKIAINEVGWNVISKRKKYREIFFEIKKQTMFLDNLKFEKRIFVILNDIKTKELCTICNEKLQVIDKFGYKGRCGNSKCITQYKKQNGIPYRSIESEKRRIANYDFKLAAEKRKKTYWNKSKEERTILHKKIAKKWKENYLKKSEKLKKEHVEKIKKTYTKDKRKIAIRKTKETWNNKTKKELENIHNKFKNTFKTKTGFNSPMQNPKSREKWKETVFKKFGVNHPMQNLEVQKRMMNTYLKNNKRVGKTEITRFNNNLFSRGSYEKEFIDKYLSTFPTLKNPEPIQYKINNKTRLYFPDFYIESLNLIIEIKSSWTFDRCGIDKELENKNKIKWQTVKNLGFGFIAIIDKNYEEFESLIRQKEGHF